MASILTSKTVQTIFAILSFLLLLNSFYKDYLISQSKNQTAIFIELLKEEKKVNLETLNCLKEITDRQENILLLQTNKLEQLINEANNNR